MVTEGKPGAVLRVRIAWKEGGWVLEKIVRVKKMTIPRTESLDARIPKNCIGMWFEAVNSKAKVLYRRFLHAPHAGVEIFDPCGEIRRIPSDCREYSIDLLIPDLPSIKKVNLFHVPDGHCPEEVKKKMPKEGPAAIFDIRQPSEGGKSGKRGK